MRPYGLKLDNRGPYCYCCNSPDWGARKKNRKTYKSRERQRTKKELRKWY